MAKQLKNYKNGFAIGETQFATICNNLVIFWSQSNIVERQTSCRYIFETLPSFAVRKTSHVVVGVSVVRQNIQILYYIGILAYPVTHAVSSEREWVFSFLFPITFWPPMLRSRLAENVLLSSSMCDLMMVLIGATK